MRRNAAARGSRSDRIVRCWSCEPAACCRKRIKKAGNATSAHSLSQTPNAPPLRANHQREKCSTLVGRRQCSQPLSKCARARCAQWRHQTNIAWFLRRSSDIYIYRKDADIGVGPIWHLPPPKHGRNERGVRGRKGPCPRRPRRGPGLQTDGETVVPRDLYPCDPHDVLFLLLTPLHLGVSLRRAAYPFGALCD